MAKEEKSALRAWLEELRRLLNRERPAGGPGQDPGPAEPAPKGPGPVPSDLPDRSAPEEPDFPELAGVPRRLRRGYDDHDWDPGWSGDLEEPEPPRRTIELAGVPRRPRWPVPKWPGPVPSDLPDRSAPKGPGPVPSDLPDRSAPEEPDFPELAGVPWP
ncbi:MAG: hypothetical protein IK095_01305, partial [Oscillospiraceae bacterium]|nr:hypothetical protein [Oscillospiraceae bacterium]